MARAHQLPRLRARSCARAIATTQRQPAKTLLTRRHERVPTPNANGAAADVYVEQRHGRRWTDILL